MTAVSDSSPLIALGQLDLLHILPALLGHVVLSPAVLSEASLVRPDAPGARAIREAIEAGVIELDDRTDIPELDRPPSGLGRGEREAIALTIALRADRLIVDDRAARDYAESLGLQTMGTARVLEIARDTGMIDAVDPLFQRLLAAGFRLPGNIVDQLRDTEAT